VLQADRRWTVQELIDLFPKTIGANVTPPEPVEANGRMVNGAAAQQLDPSSWTSLGDSISYWERQLYYDARRQQRPSAS